MPYPLELVGMALISKFYMFPGAKREREEFACTKDRVENRSLGAWSVSVT